MAKVSLRASRKTDTGYGDDAAPSVSPLVPSLEELEKKMKCKPTNTPMSYGTKKKTDKKKCQTTNDGPAILGTCATIEVILRYTVFRRK